MPLLASIRMKRLLTLIALAAALPALAQSVKSLHDIPLKTIEGKDTSLKAYEGKVVLLVNVASKCGYTRQYKGLEAVYQKYKDKGVVVVGVPSNDFGGQEPGSAEEIVEFCQKNFGVSFPLMSKSKVLGSDKHPLFAALTGKESPFPGDVKWNFGKFVIGKDGKLVARFGSGTEPESAELSEAIEKSLKAGK
jgi:glutathione peroxidase